MNLASKYAHVIDERWEAESVVGLVLSNDNYKFKGDRTCVVYSIPIAPMVDYSRSGTSRYGTPNDISRNIQTLTVAKDRAFTFIIDKGDEVQSEYLTNPGAALARQIHEGVVPEFDTYCFRVMANSAVENGHTDATAVTKSNAYELLLKGIQHMSDRNVPIDNCVCYCTFAYGGFLMQDSAFVKSGDISQEMVKKGIVGRAAGVDIVLVPNTRLPAGASFLIVHKDAAIAPRQLEEFRIHSDPPGVSGSLCEGRVLFDCFVLDEKADGIYFHGGQEIIKTLKFMTSASNTGKSTIIMNTEKEAAGNKWYAITAATRAALPTVTYGTPINTASGGSWHGATVLTSNSVELTPTSGHKYVAVCETDDDNYPIAYETKKLSIG